MQSPVLVSNVTGVSWVCSALSVYDEVTSHWFTLGPQLNPGWAWGLNLWPMAGAVWWPPAWGRAWGTEPLNVSRCWKLQICSFWTLHDAVRAWSPLTLWDPSEPLWAVHSDGQQHLEQGKTPCSPLCCSLRELRHPEDKSPFSQGSPSWDRDVTCLPRLPPVQQGALGFALSPGAGDQSFHLLVLLLPSFLWHLAQQIWLSPCPGNVGGLRCDTSVVCRDWASAEGWPSLSPCSDLAVAESWAIQGFG